MQKKDFIILGASVLCALAVCFGFRLGTKSKVGWFSLPEAFNKFEYKVELEKKFTKTEEARKKITDSLELELQVLAKTIEAKGKNAEQLEIAQFTVKRDAYYNKKQQFEEDNAQMKSQFNQQILTQLNQYIKDYGKENGYKIILGAEGSGSLMYGEEAIDITKEVIEYINGKYQGNTKMK